jgi:hypothetical protein
MEFLWLLPTFPFFSQRRQKTAHSMSLPTEMRKKKSLVFKLLEDTDNSRKSRDE